MNRETSTSAKRLMEHYGRTLNILGLEANIQAIKAFIHGLPSSEKHDAVKICIDRITDAKFNWVDPASNVSFRHLLALEFIALQDENRPIDANVYEAKERFVDGLYEMQQGFKYSDMDLKTKMGVSPLSITDSFEKIIEKLKGDNPIIQLNSYKRGSPGTPPFLVP